MNTMHLNNWNFRNVAVGAALTVPGVDETLFVEERFVLNCRNRLRVRTASGDPAGTLTLVENCDIELQRPEEVGPTKVNGVIEIDASTAFEWKNETLDHCSNLRSGPYEIRHDGNAAHSVLYRGTPRPELHGGTVAQCKVMVEAHASRRSRANGPNGVFSAFNWIGGGYNSVWAEEATRDSVLEAVNDEFSSHPNLRVNLMSVRFGREAVSFRDREDLAHAGILD